MIEPVIVVEGKHDRQRLEQVVSATIVETGGASMNDDILPFLKAAVKTRGVIILTDPDGPGNRIRQWLTEHLPQAQHAYIAKKDCVTPNKVGVEHASDQAILEALKHVRQTQDHPSISWESYVNMGLANDKQKRLALSEALHVGYANGKTFFKRLNQLGISAQEVREHDQAYRHD